nr:hypothetical protein [Tanacetum cinerariifolium]
MMENVNPPPISNHPVLTIALRAQAIQELHELQRISAFVDSRLKIIERFLNNFANQPNETNMNNLKFDDESIDTPRVSPFPHSDNDLDDGEMLNELIEYEKRKHYDVDLSDVASDDEYASDERWGFTVKGLKEMVDENVQGSNLHSTLCLHCDEAFETIDHSMSYNNAISNDEMTFAINGSASQLETAQQLLQKFVAAAGQNQEAPPSGQGYNTYPDHASAYPSQQPPVAHAPTPATDYVGRPVYGGNSGCIKQKCEGKRVKSFAEFGDFLLAEIADASLLFRHQFPMADTRRAT